MSEKFIETLTFRKIINLIDNTKNRILFSSANLHEEVSIALLEASKKGVKIKVILDPAEENYRNGLGDIKSIELLEKAAKESHLHVRLLDFNGLVALWKQFYNKLSDEDKLFLPLHNIYFLGTTE